MDSSSVRVGLSDGLHRILNAETSAARRFKRDQSVDFSHHLESIGRAAQHISGLAASTWELNRLDSSASSRAVSSTGTILTVVHLPWQSTLSQTSRMSSLTPWQHMRVVIMSSWLATGGSQWIIPKSATGLTAIREVFCQVSSTRSPFTSPLVRAAIGAYPSIKPRSSTVTIRKIAQLTTPGSVVASTGCCRIALQLWGW